MKKKGVELTMNTIIIAALSLTVLVVLIIVFTGSFGDLVAKFTGIKDKVSSKADCIVIGDNPEKDRDGDGYLDGETYDVKYKDEKGKTATKKGCACDIDHGEDKDTHQDTTEHC